MRIRVNFDKMESDELVLGEPGEFDCALAARLLHGPPPALATATRPSASAAAAAGEPATLTVDRAAPQLTSGVVRLAAAQQLHAMTLPTAAASAAAIHAALGALREARFGAVDARTVPAQQLAQLWRPAIDHAQLCVPHKRRF